LLAAAMVLGVAAGFIVSLVVEMVRPRVADAAEAERVAGARVITVIRPYVPNPDRARRRADMEASPLIDASAEGYRMLYLHVSATGSVLPIVTVTGDDADIVATVAANLAVASAYEARSTLLVDGDLGNGAVSGVLRIPPEPGLASVIAEKAVWAESIHATTVGRDRTLDVIPSGIWPLGRSVSERGTERVRRDLRRLTGRYDFAVLVADEAHAERGATSMLPGPDVIIVARAGHTPLAWLTAAVDGLGRTGERVRGIVLWDSEPPRVPTRDEVIAMVGRRRKRQGMVETESATV
jgi:Mrp family chromosome partitioning ATPase